MELARFELATPGCDLGAVALRWVRCERRPAAPLRPKAPPRAGRRSPRAGAVTFLVELFNHTVEGLDDVELWLHTCWGNPGGQHCFDPQISYEPSVDIYLNRLKGAVWTIESKDTNHTLLPAFKPYNGNLPKSVAVWMI